MLGSNMPAKMFFFREIIGEDIKKNYLNSTIRLYLMLVSFFNKTS